MHYLYGKDIQVNDLTADQKSTISAIVGLGGAAIGATGGAADVTQGSMAAVNAVTNNYLTPAQVDSLSDCFNGRKSECKTAEGKKSYFEKLKAESERLDKEVANICKNNPLSEACKSGVDKMMAYGAMKKAWTTWTVYETTFGDGDVADVKRTTDQTFNYVFNAPNARNNITQYYDDIDSRANFFGASANYYRDLGIGVKWFGGAYNVSIDDLGGGEPLSVLKFLAGAVVTGQGSNLYNWRSEAGNALMNDGFNNFKNLYNNGTNNPVAWDINQLRREQTVLQPIHEKYLGDADFFRGLSNFLTDSNWPAIKWISPQTRVPGGVDITKYPSRVNYGCQMLYGGCK
jgi:hypothetical protein